MRWIKGCWTIVAVLALALAGPGITGCEVDVDDEPNGYEVDVDRSGDDFDVDVDRDGRDIDVDVDS